MCNYIPDVFVQQLSEINYDRRNLVEHIGVVESKQIEKELINGHTGNTKWDSADVIRIKLRNKPEIYFASGKVVYYDYVIQVGDTIMVYTKPITSIFGNVIARGSSTSTTQSANQIYHLVTTKDNSIIINFDMHKEEAKKMSWMFGGAGIGLFMLYLYYRHSEQRAGAEDMNYD